MEAITSLVERYPDNIAIRALLQLIPFGIGGAVDVVAAGKAERIKQARLRVFFDELAGSSAPIDESLLDSDDFLHCYFSIARHVINTHRAEKIQMFARLLSNSASAESPTNLEEFEDLLKILDELSFREISALAILDSFRHIPRSHDENDLQWCNKFWDSFEVKISEELDVPASQVRDFTNRIARTGCYEMFTGGYFDYTGGKGKLTPTYERLKFFIRYRREPPIGQPA